MTPVGKKGALMIQSVSLPLCAAVREEYGGWGGLREELEELRADRFQHQNPKQSTKVS